MKDFLKKAFPFLTIAAGAIPGGNLAMTALGTILNVVPSDGKKVTWDDLGNGLINATPEQRAALAAEENRHVEAMAQMNINSAEEFERIFASDRADARKLQATVQSKMPAVLAILAVVGLFGSLVLLFFHPPSASARDAVMLMIGGIIATAKDVYGFFFGSSAGSDEKSRTIAEIAKAP